MNRWAQMLADIPVLLQRMIARHSRISLPRACSAPDRHTRLRAALCHAATVRATYTTLDDITKAALHDLQTHKRGIAPQDLVSTYGAVRSWTQLAADPRPRTIAEHLIVLGWLLPRPATPRHPARYLVPPELRRWLPQPLSVPTHGHAPTPAPVPVLPTIAILLLLGAQQPLAVRADGSPRRAVLHLIEQRLPQIAQVASVTQWAFPLLHHLGLVAPRHDQVVTTLVGQRFLALSPDQQLAQLQQAWLLSPTPDPWISRTIENRSGIDWIVLRQRLWQWAHGLPADQLVDPRCVYTALAATFGPLADGHTHGFRSVDRVPWQPARAAAVFDAALRGPLHWLGLIGWSPAPDQIAAHAQSQAYLARNTAPTLPRADQVPWQYGVPGELVIPHAAVDARLFAFQPFATWQHATTQHTIYHITPTTIARACAAGESVDRLWDVLMDAVGPIPAAWLATLDAPTLDMHFATMPVLLAAPATLDRIARKRTLRRYLAQRPAPGVALVQPQHVEPLRRALARHHLPIVAPAPVPSAPSSVRGLTAGDAAALLVACAFYHRYAPTGAPLIPDTAVEHHLRSCLTAPLRSALDAALAQINPSQRAAPSPDGERSDDPLALLDAALFAGQTVTITYYTASRDAWSTRTVQPLAIEQRDDQWHLHAYCTTRGEKRIFRVDRISAVHRAATDASAADRITIIRRLIPRRRGSTADRS
jgi:hypothetical protein